MPFIVSRDSFLHTRDDRLCHARFGDARSRARSHFSMDFEMCVRASISVASTQSPPHSYISHSLLSSHILFALRLAAINKLRCPTTTAQLVDSKLLSVRAVMCFLDSRLTNAFSFLYIYIHSFFLFFNIHSQHLMN